MGEGMHKFCIDSRPPRCWGQLGPGSHAAPVHILPVVGEREQQFIYVVP